MAKSFLGNPTDVGIVLENDTAGPLTYTGRGFTAEELYDATLLGGLYDPTDQTLVTFPVETGFTLDNIMPYVEEFQSLNGVKTIYREVRDNGGCSVTIAPGYDSAVGVGTDITDGTASMLNFLNACWIFYNGVTEDTGAAISDPPYNGLEDTNTTKITDLVGWGVEILFDTKIKVVLHNCEKLEMTGPDIAYRKAEQLTLKFSEARFVEIIPQASVLTGHDDTL